MTTAEKIAFKEACRKMHERWDNLTEEEKEAANRYADRKEKERDLENANDILSRSTFKRTHFGNLPQ